MIRLKWCDGGMRIMMKRDKEVLIIHEMNAKYWNFTTSKIAEEAILLDLILILRIKTRIINQGKSDVHMDNK